MTKILATPFEVSADDSSSSLSRSSFRKPSMDKMLPKGPEADSEKRCRVTFAKRVRIKKIRSYTLYSDQERDAVWYDEEEYAEIKKRCLQSIRMMMRGDMPENDEFCSRGLEVRTKNNARARKELRLKASCLVLEEQDIQMDMGITDDERIREIYLYSAGDAHSRAHFYGLRDAKAAQEYLEARL
eukprot:Nitzschia sp. Nitz4//scaffold106_size73319//19329//19883//NITZ4_005730-RA/size73319-processed-gene-0.66-mRNA-1//-1//CDS//3329532502//3192//frame0